MSHCDKRSVQHTEIFRSIFFTFGTFIIFLYVGLDTRCKVPVLNEMQYAIYGPGSVVGITTGYGLDGPGIESRWGARFSAPVHTGTGAHPASCTMGARSFPGVKSGRGVTLSLHPLLVLWSWKGRAIPLLPLWAVRPVQSLSACTRVRFTLSLAAVASRYFWTTCDQQCQWYGLATTLAPISLAVGYCDLCYLCSKQRTTKSAVVERKKKKDFCDD